MQRFLFLLLLLFGVSHNLIAQRPERGASTSTGGSTFTGSGTPGAITAWTSATGLGDATPGTCILIAGGSVSADTSCLISYSVGLGPPSANCVAGSELYLDATAGQFYACGPSNNTWKLISNTVFALTDTGLDDTYGNSTACAGFPAVYENGQTVVLQATTANTGAATLDCGPGAKAIKLVDGATDPATGNITSKQPAILQYDTAANGGSGAWLLLVNSTASSTETLTNKTLDAEGAGNIVTITAQPFIPFATCQNTTASLAWQHNASPPAANCYGSNAVKGVADFDASTDEALHDYVAFPDDFTGTVDVVVYSFAAATTGTARGGINIDCAATTEDHDPAVTNATTFAITPNGTANRLVATTVTGITVTGCAAGELARIRFYRDADGTSGTDDMTGDLRVIGLRLKTRRAM